MDESDGPGEPNTTYLLSADESFMSDREQVPPQKERKFIVFEGCLLELFKVCRTCLAPCRNTIVVQGTQVKKTSTCVQNHVERWWSQPQVSGKAAGNILICAGILFSGAPVATTLRLLKSINVATVSERTFHYYQQAYLLPAVKQSDEVPSSNAMEKVAFVRGLTKLKREDFTIGSFISDRHPGVEHHMRTEERDTKHYFDTWHIDKGLKKKLQAASRKSESRELQVWVQPIANHLYYCAALGNGNGPLLVSMWLSLLNHVVDKHDGHDGPFSECLHQPLSDRAWLTEGEIKILLNGVHHSCVLIPGTPAYNKLRSIVSSPRLLKDIRHLSPGSQTSSVEAFNSVLIGFASKSRAFTPEGMEAR
ncbi:hypothetical protein HPB47_003672 [Ixodes persulcatus]|uniref:Uncharacterized protein n=1 Tax=Ixodes persulcatus TaxID=34615 RepID=A0AC60PIU6_IXOPE|nr:hypothetical protein HPB47_003672 [Ixodes persulcatus]